MKFDKPIALAADHGGYELKEAIKAHLDELGVAYTDFGTDSTERPTECPKKRCARQIENGEGNGLWKTQTCKK